MSNVIAMDTHKIVADAGKAIRKARKPRASKADREQRIADLNNAIVDCGWNTAHNEFTTANIVTELKSLYAAGKFDLTTTRRRFHCGYMAYRLKAAPSRDKVTAGVIAKMLAILERPNSKSQDANRRTEEQERAYGASRGAWHGILSRAGIETTEKRGKGSAGRAGKAGKASKASKASKGGKADKPVPGVSVVEAPVGGLKDAYSLALHVKRTITDLLHCAKKRAKYQASADLQRALSLALAEISKINLEELDGAPSK